MPMFINVRPGDMAPIHASPDNFSTIHVQVPHGIKVDAVFFDGLWYHVQWSGVSGFMPAICLSAYDPSPLLWQKRYGTDECSVSQTSECNQRIVNLQADLNLFFSPFEPQIVIDGVFGPDTREALCKFQLIRGLEPHGIADDETKVSLYIATLRLRKKSKRK